MNPYFGLYIAKGVDIAKKAFSIMGWLRPEGGAKPSISGSKEKLIPLLHAPT